MLEAVRWRNRASGEEITQPIRHLFLFIGADPNTDWLAQCGVALDAKGFVRTGAEIGAGRHPLETNRSGVFAIGDVRSGSVKRVAAAVGEGAQVVAALHAYLAQAGGHAAQPALQRRVVMADECKHAAGVRDVTPSALGCEECLKIGFGVGASAALPHLRPCRLLRRLAQPPRHQAFSRDPPSDHRGLRSAGRLGLVLHRRDIPRPRRSHHAA